MHSTFKALCLAWAGVVSAQGAPATSVQSATHNVSAPSGYSAWSHGPSTNADYFPIAVWLQSPRNAARYKAAGINLYVGLWRGPTAEQLAQLKDAGMGLICDQNPVALANRESPVILGWMHGDEPDNAQSRGRGQGYGPPVLPEKIIGHYQSLTQADPTRPVLLNLGQGVAWDQYIGRGVRRNHPEDYKEYVKGCDIASFDIYPAVHDAAEIAGKLEFVARGVERLVRWSGPDKIVWNCIECTHISNPGAKATPLQVRAEVWMALTHGSRGLIYFVHQFQPTFQEAALLEDPEMLAAVTSINRQIRELAPVLNSPAPAEPLKVLVRGMEEGKSSPVAWLHKEHGGSNYVFAVNMRNEPTQCSFSMTGWEERAQVQVLSEQRSISVPNGQFADDFKPYEVHLYAVRSKAEERTR